jgi:hypothetical protein
MLIVQLLVVCGIAYAVGEVVLTQQQLEEKLKANRILDMYITDAGITGMETNEYNAPSNEFLVPGVFEKMPEKLSTLAKDHDVRILPSQASRTINKVLWLPILSLAFNMIVLFSILITLIRINKRIASIERLIKK